jgi:AraC-like DNA-binding protein/ligand-binding sensor protein
MIAGAGYGSLSTIMPPEKPNNTVRPNATDIDIPFPLYISFAEITGVPLKLCGRDGQLIADAPPIPHRGPCALLSAEEAFCDICAESHAAAASMSIELRRPYIHTCHTRLVSWAVPILQNNEPLPVVILCGGVLLSTPDIALIRHVRKLAENHDRDPDEFVRSLDSVPVLSREHIRLIADFLFQMSSAFASYATLPGAADVVTPPPTPDIPATPIVFPHARTRETKKAKVERAGLLEQRTAESEIVRLLRDRKSEVARNALAALLKEATASGQHATTNLAVAETFTRLFRNLSTGTRIPRSLIHKQSHLVHSVMSGDIPLEQTPAKFIRIAEEMTGEPRPRKIKAIQTFIEKNLARKLTLGTVGEKFGLKEKPLDALIRKHCGMGFVEYVTLLRVSEAKRLLRSTELNMGEIARRTGFTDQSYFTKVFKARIGLTPTEFRHTKETRRGHRTSAE